MKLRVPWTSKGKKAPGRRTTSDDAASVHERLDDLTRQLERISRVTAGKTPPGGAADPTAGRRDPQSDEFSAEDRGEGSETAGDAGERTHDASPLRPVYADSDFERTMAEIATRQHVLDGEDRSVEQRSGDMHRPNAPPEQTLSALKETLGKITSQIEALRRPCPAADAVPALRQELSDIGRSLAEAVPRQAIEAIEAEVRGLGERIDQTRQSGLDSSVLANLEQGLADVRDALQSLKPAESLVEVQNAIQGLSNKIDTIVATQQDPVVLQQLESAITGLRGIVAHVASDDTLARLTEEVRGIAEKIEQQQLSRGDTIAFGQLEDRVAKLVERLDASGPRFNHLEAIERGLTDVLVHLEEQRARFGAVTRITGTDPVLESLKRDLDSVNETLNRVVDRLATIETGNRRDDRPTPEPPAAPAASAAPTAGPAKAGAAAAPATARERPPIDPNLPPDHPLEPGAAHGRNAPSAADRIAASEAALGPTNPLATPDEGESGKPNPIAAARQAARAAQAASQAPKDPDGKEAAGAAEGESKSRGQRLSSRVRSVFVGTSVFVLAVGAVHVTMTLFAPRPPDTSDIARSTESQLTRAPAVPQAPESIARSEPDPAVTGSTEQAAQNAASEIPFIAPPPSSPFPGIGDSDRPAPVQSIPAAAQADGTVTGSISPQAVVPDAHPTIPLPPSRPAGSQPDKPRSRLAAAADAGDPAAAYELAMRHIDGRGVRRSYKDAAHWLARASKQGLAPAQFRLGALYEKGLGVRKDLNEARRLYAASAGNGNAKAMHNLAVLYAEGGTGKPDYTAATKWFRKAADRGIADSQYNLGILYARGVGVEQNLAESYKWFALAAQQGDKEAAGKRDDIAGRLDPDSLMAARLAVKTWTMALQPEAATTVKGPPDGWDRHTPSASVDRRPRTRERGTPAPLKLGPG